MTLFAGLQLLTQVFTLLIAIVGLWRVARRLEKNTMTIDGKMDKLLEVTAHLAREEGKAQGRAEGAAGTRSSDSPRLPGG